jgi:DNA-binding MarR family transcriptional regulator
MRNTEFTALAFQIRSFAGIGTKLMVQDLEERLAERMPGVNGPQYGVLRILSCNPSTIRELSDHMMLAPSTLVPIVDRLEHEGMVVRGKDPDDRRRTPLMLTEHGRQMLAQVPPVDVSDHLCQALNALGAEKSRQLSLLLQELIGQLAPGHDIATQVLAVSRRATDGVTGCHRSVPATPAAAAGVIETSEPPKKTDQ